MTKPAQIKAAEATPLEISAIEFSLDEPAEINVLGEEAAVPPAPSGSRRGGGMVAAALGVALFTSALSVGGLIVAGRAISDASLVIADAREKQAELAKVTVVMGQMEKLNVQQAALLAAAGRISAGQPVTNRDLRRYFDDLRIDLQRNDPQNGQLGLIRDSQSELGERISQVAVKLDRVERALSPSRKAIP